MLVSTLSDATAGQLITSWQRVAVATIGRRFAQHAVAGAGDRLDDGAVVILDHAGPAASRWSLERAIGSAIAVDPVSDRRCSAIEDDGWLLVVDEFAAAARIVRAAGGRVVVAVDDDGLLHTALSPLTSSPPRSDRVLAVLRACAPCDLLLVIEDLAPRGIDVTTGLAFAKHAVLVAGAQRLYATGGTAWLPPLRDRKKGRSTDCEGFDLATAAWAVRRVVGVEVHAVVRSDAPLALLRSRAHRLGLTGFLIDERNAATTTTTAAATTVPDPFESR